jgi:hypothetical protein
MATKTISNNTVLGWGYSLDTSKPIEEIHTGTVGQILEKIKGDEVYNAHRYNQPCQICWFTDGKPIKSVNHNPSIGFWNLEWLAGDFVKDFIIEY